MGNSQDEETMAIAQELWEENASPFALAVERNLKELRFVSVGLSGICPECQSDYNTSPREFFSGVENGDICDEGGFSWSHCGGCGSHLGGDRFAAHGYIPGGGVLDDDTLVHFSVCVDCLVYIANGDEPDEWEG